MRRNSLWPQALAVLALFVGGAAYGRQDANPPSDAKPDNTKVNKRDRAAGAMTADQQGNSKTDRELARKIRRALVEDKTLSSYAHNVKVIAKDGAVTLKGPVRSEEEKKTVETKAAQAGASTIDNQMEVAPKTKKTRKET